MLWLQILRNAFGLHVGHDLWEFSRAEENIRWYCLPKYWGIFASAPATVDGLREVDLQRKPTGGGAVPSHRSAHLVVSKLARQHT